MTRDRWLDEGMTVLREQGVAGVRVDRIAARLGMTKGSFHHHFAGIDDYRQALLQRYEASAQDATSASVAAVFDLPAEQALMKLPDHYEFDPLLEAAVRGWASQDAGARAVQQRVDAARLDALVGLWQQRLSDPHRARIAALVPYLLLVGSSVAAQRPTESEMREVFALLATLVPSVD